MIISDKTQLKGEITYIENRDKNNARDGKRTQLKTSSSRPYGGEGSVLLGQRGL